MIGTVVAVRGKEIEGGKFEVEDHCYCNIPLIKNPLPKISNDK